MERRGDVPPRLSLGTPFRRKERSGLREEASTRTSEDAAVRATDADALLSRLSAVNAGYLDPDPYVALLAQGFDTNVRRPLLINIGTALRSHQVDARVSNFLRTGSITGPPMASTHTAFQIVSLGAGSDTRFWRMGDVSMHPDALWSRVSHYIEIDYPEIASHKVHSIHTQPMLHTALQEIVLEEHGLASARYTLLGEELSALVPPEGSGSTRALDSLFAKLDPSLPTLLLWECVLAYLEPCTANRILTTLCARLPNVAIVSYDMCVAGDTHAPNAPPDRFGKVMLQNLAARNLGLAGARAYTTPEAYKHRFHTLLSSTAGAHGPCEMRSEAYTLQHAWRTLPRAEQERLSRLEGLDEVEELEMLLGHYCMCFAQRSACD
ncbi:[phosphatase 2A protein]-leucine-carboxy methyltransferase [Malassezia vespertilionis]|uniref:Leucine carboxyl methyltransferase 1 n=1 Tax=Malassezia vespertilionis TaxID=2020962 RepID=A0A2N1JF77_9BASI|nr:[phosphatase 2A protein]-leucine-carboxy methyltransferase [Malassezia vespertilionis]PKI85202.1 Ppm1p [Malassezia vespertilionis]WFD05761.1 [phosphatase 2A protein]-leucine-carboxy methyltransferase [Malassezia vespertilionis]